MIDKTRMKSTKPSSKHTTKEKYDSFWTKIFYLCLILSGVGIGLMIINVNEFRKKLIMQNPNYKNFHNIQTFLFASL